MGLLLREGREGRRGGKDKGGERDWMRPTSQARGKAGEGGKGRGGSAPKPKNRTSRMQYVTATTLQSIVRYVENVLILRKIAIFKVLFVIVLTTTISSNVQVALIANISRVQTEAVISYLPWLI